MKKSLLLISLLAGMAVTFTGCGADDNINIPEAPAGTGVNISDSENNTAAENEAVPSVTEVTMVTEPEVSAVTSETEAVVTEITAASSDKKNEQKTVQEIVSENAASGSPFEKGYIESGYSEMMSRYYNVEYNGSRRYSYSLNCSSITLGTAWFLNKSEGTVTGLDGGLKSEETEAGYRKLIEYINSRAGEGNYRFHDAYTEQYTDVYGPDEETVSSYSTHVDIVLSSELDKYIKAADADKSKYIVRFELTNEGRIVSEYEHHSRISEMKKNIIRDLNGIAPEYAFGIDECRFYDYDNVITEVHIPFFSAEKSASVNGVPEEKFWLNRRRCSSALTEGTAVSDADELSAVSVTVYCRPDTDTAALTSVLEKIYPVTSEYGVGYINIDVLENESDFERYRNCDGDIPEETVKLVCREHHYNNPEFNWGVPGK